jgi:hypothetical protein
VYVDPQTGYTNVERFDSKEKDDDEDEDFSEPHDMSPEELRIQLEGNKSEGEK